MLVKEIIPPLGEPVSLDEFKAHARIDGTEEDDYILSLLKAARQTLERRLDVVTTERTLEIVLDRFPGYCSLPIFLPVSPVGSIVAIDYRNADGELETWDEAEYLVETGAGGFILPLPGHSYPTSYGHGGVVITGIFGSAEVSDDFKHAIKILASTWFEHRESVGMGTVPTIPHSLEFILSSLRHHSF